MLYQLIKPLGRRTVITVVAFLAAMTLTGRTGGIDANGNGMSDVWEQIYGAAGLDPNGDADGDGVSNYLESLAGTNPFDSNSVPRITLAALVGSSFRVTMPSALGKQYQLQSVQAIDSGAWSNWVTEASLVARTGTVVTLTAPASVATKFFRIAISDVDTDGDGVNDWEEYQLGLDPAKAESNGQLDGNGQPLGDHAYVTNKLAVQNIASIYAIDSTANQPDPGQSAINLGVLTVTRGGFPLNAVTVNLDLAPPGAGVATEGVDYSALPRSLNFPVGVSAQTVTVTPLPNTNRMSPALATLRLLAAAGYTVGTASNASVLVYPSATPTGTGLTGQYFTNASSTYASSLNFNAANLRLTRVDPTVDFTWGTSTNPITNSSGYYCVRWTGQVQPQYSETYYFVANTDDGVKLWVNDQLIIDNWATKSASDLTGSITLQGGVRYNLKMEYFQSTSSAVAHLSWYSPSQSKQIIPSSRLYPTNMPPAPTAVTSPLTAVGFLGQPFSYTITGANSASNYSAAGLPPGLACNRTNGVISGIPGLAGFFQVALTASNTVGLSPSVLALQVFDTGSAVTREVWTGAPGVNVTDIPVSSPAGSTNSLGTLEGITNLGEEYGERIRGFLTAPVTGNYYFWIAASDSAELWISNDSEPANKVRRAYVLPSANPVPPPANGTASRQWNLQPNQKSPWLALVAGQRYYVEILHKAGTGTNDNWAVAWLQDPTGTNNTPGTIVPGYVLSPYYPPPPAYIPGTLYAANMLPQGSAVSSASGSATLRVSADGSQAVLSFKYSGLGSALTGEHIHSDAYLSHPSQIIFDIDSAMPQPDGSYVWDIAPVGSLTVADILEIIQQGKSYINIHTVNYPSGEINGHFTLATGTQTFTPPPPPPAWTDDHSSSNAAARFLIQATFGPSPAEISSVQALGYAGWIDNQISLPVSRHLPVVLANVNSDPTTPYPGASLFNTWWQQSTTAPDQLRQRVAFALSEIMVVSEAGVLADNGRALSSYYDTLLANAFGNFRDLLRAVTLTPAMGLYLDMRANDKGSMITGLHPNENYAREILQLFSIGLYRLWPDGTLVMDSQGSLVPTYDQNVIMGFASTFTGWNYYQTNQANGRLPTSFSPSANYTNSMVLVPTHHELGTKRLLDNVILPQAWGSQADSANTNYDSYCSRDLELAMDSIFKNENVGPFICRQLIQRLVTSHPNRDYLYRVAQKFNDNGAGVRGDMQAVIKAILLDYEARSSTMSSRTTFGKQREPILRVTAPARAFSPVTPPSGTYSQTGTQTITVTTPPPHRMNTSDDLILNFTDSSGQPPPPSRAYNDVTVTSPMTFTIPAPGLLTGTYTQYNTTITLTLSSHGLAVSNSAYLAFTTGGATSGAFQVVTAADSSHLTVTAADSATRSGACQLHKWTGGGFVVTSRTNCTVSTTLPHGLTLGDNVFLNFTAAGSPADGQYAVFAVPDATHFSVGMPTNNNQTQNGLTTYPLIAPPLNRSGTVTLQQSTWVMNSTDGNLTQTPLRSPTVFNFFFPDYKFPGILTSAGLTTPEFQLTSDTEVANQMNFLQGGTLGNTSNTNGLSSFVSGNGAIVLDIGPWMTTNYTASAGVPSLVDSLDTLLTGGQLAPAARTTIISYVTNTVNFPYSTPPTYTQMRDRVRGTLHLILTSPDFTIQK